jgi:hypothetical protein
MSEKPRLAKHVQEVEEEIYLVESIMPTKSPPPPAPPFSPGGGGDSQPWRPYNKQRINEYSQLIKNIKAKYQDPQLADLFEAAYVQLDIYLGKYLDLIGQEKATQFSKENPGIILDIGESAKLCRYPLARKYIITIPREDIEAKPPIWTSMAHELGHFVYWNSEFDTSKDQITAGGKNHALFSSEIAKTQGINRDELENISEITETQAISRDEPEDITHPGKKMLSITKERVLAVMLLGWSEEIFADAFGSTIAGKDFAEQAKAAYLNDLTNQRKKRFLMDRDHPYPFLRPFISATALENKSGKNTLWRSLKIKIAANANLEENFKNSLQPGTVTNISDEDLTVSIKVGEKDIKLTIDEIKQALKKLIPILAGKISTSKPLKRGINIWDFIEEFDDPQPTLIYRVIEGIGYWINLLWS